MPTIYISYKKRDSELVEKVVSRLEANHTVYVDFKLSAGADWRTQLCQRLREAEVFVVLACKETAKSCFQNSEIGAARFCSAFLDQKLIIPIVLDDGPIVRTLEDLDCLRLPDRDPNQIVKEIEDAIQRRTQRVRLFISHAHKDEKLAAALVDVIRDGLEIPREAIRCTSVPGYTLDLGAMAPDVLRRELGSTGCILAILTPNSLAAEWVLFELGAAWANTKLTMPLLAGGLKDQDIPGPFRGMAGGDLSKALTMDRVLGQVATALGYRSKTDRATLQRRIDALTAAAAGVRGLGRSSKRR